MKRTIIFKALLVCLLLLQTSVMAQTYQKGYAKTKGRLTPEGSVIPGKPLDSVFVQIKGGNAFYSKSNGQFEFPITAQSFSLKTVEKEDYVLADPDVLTRTYSYSNNQIIFSLEKRSVQDYDSWQNERKLRKQAQNQLRIKEREYDSLLELHKMSEEEHAKALQKLYSDSDNDIPLIKNLALRYSKIDFDYADDFERQICTYILNGNLAKADSMLNSKGNLTIRFMRWNLDREELINDSYHKFEICKLRHDNDSAAYYIGMRACLDTLNVEWQLEAGDYISNFTTDYNTAYSLYDRALRMAQMRYGEQSVEAISAMVSLVRFYERKGEYQTALNYAARALPFLEALSDNNSIAQQCFKNMAMVYDEMGDTLNAFNFYNRSLDICKSVYGEEHGQTASAYHNLGAFFVQTCHFDKSLEYFQKSNEIYTTLNDTISEGMASNYEGISVVFKNLSKYDTAFYCINQAIEINRIIFGENHPYLANNYYNLGSLHLEANDYDRALKYFCLATDINKGTIGKYHPDVGRCYNSIGLVYKKKGDYEKALEYFGKALEIYSKTFEDNNYHYVAVYHNIGQLYSDRYDLNIHEEVAKNYIEEAANNHNKALNISLSALGEKDTKTATCYDNLGQDYLKMGKYELALENALKALSIRDAIYNDKNNLDMASSYSNVASIYWKQGNIDKAIEYLEQCGQILDNIYKDEENYYHAIFKFNLGMIYRKQGDLPKAIGFVEESIRMLVKIVPENHSELQRFRNVVEEMKAELNDQ